MFTTQEATEVLLAGKISKWTFFCVTAHFYVVERITMCEGQLPSVIIKIHLLYVFYKKNKVSFWNSFKMSINVWIYVVVEVVMNILILLGVTPYSLVQANCVSEKPTASKVRLHDDTSRVQLYSLVKVCIFAVVPKGKYNITSMLKEGKASPV